MLLTRAQKPLPPHKKPQRVRVADVTFRLARGQIHSTVPAWLILPDRFAAKKPEKLAFPRPPKAPDGSLIYERIVLPVREGPEKLKRRPEDSPVDGKWSLIMEFGCFNQIEYFSGSRSSV